MKKTLLTILIFAILLAGLVALAPLVKRDEPAVQTAESAPVVLNEMDADRATVITLRGDHASFAGAGAAWTAGELTIGYPGTYRLSGTLEDASIRVDLDDFTGAVYLILDGAAVRCSTGPALYVRQAELTELILSDGTENSFIDGEGYVIPEKRGESLGAAIYSEDDLLIRGGGALTVNGRNADGIRSKDALTIAGGHLTIRAADDGIQASDRLEISAGSINVDALGDGLTATKGGVWITGGHVTLHSADDGVQAYNTVNLTGGTLGVDAQGSGIRTETGSVFLTGGRADIHSGTDGVQSAGDISLENAAAEIISGGDGCSAAGALTVADSAVRVVAHGGAGNYVEIALEDISAKGLKAETIVLTGGSVRLDTADDALHAQDITVDGAALTISSGDDALHSAGTLTLDGRVRIRASYEALEAESVLVRGGSIYAAAERRAVDAGDGGFTVLGGAMTLESPRCARSGGTMALRGGLVYMTCDGSEAPLKFREGAVTGGTLFLTSESNDRATLLEGGELDGSLLFLLNTPLPAGTPVALSSTAGEALSFTTMRDASAILIASGALTDFQEYTFNAGTVALQAALTDGAAVTQQQAQRGGSRR